MELKNRIEFEFVKQVLTEQMGKMEKTQVRRINKLLNFHSKRLINDRSYEVTADSGKLSATATLTHPDYERFLDMNKDRTKRKESRTEIKWKRIRKRKAFPIHNSIVFGYKNRIGYSLAYGLTQEIKEHFLTLFGNQTI